MNNNNRCPQCHQCPRCGNLLFREGEDVYCICCGFRLSFYFTSIEGARRLFKIQALIARLIYNRSDVLIDFSVNEMPGRGRERVTGFIMLARK